MSRRGTYSITLMFEPAAGVRTAHLQLGNAVLDAPVGDADTQHTFENVPLESGDWGASPPGSARQMPGKGVTYVHVVRETHKKRDSTSIYSSISCPNCLRFPGSAYVLLAVGAGGPVRHA